jgi:hypothetical protein
MAVTAEDGERGFSVKYEETILYLHPVTYFMAVMCETLGKIDEGSTHRYLSAWVKYGGRSPKFIWAPCHVMCTDVLIG